MVSAASVMVILSTLSQMPAVTMLEQLGEARVDAGAEHRGTAPLAGAHETVAVGTEAPAVDERGGADHVDAGFEDADELVDVLPHRVVDDAVGPEREQRVDVVGRGDAHGVDPAQLADVAPDLLRRPGVAADQLEVGVSDDGAHRAPTDVARRPLHHSNRHQETSFIGARVVRSRGAGG